LNLIRVMPAKGQDNYAQPASSAKRTDTLALRGGARDSPCRRVWFGTIPQWGL